MNSSTLLRLTLCGCCTAAFALRAGNATPINLHQPIEKATAVAKAAHEGELVIKDSSGTNAPVKVNLLEKQPDLKVQASAADGSCEQLVSLAFNEKPLIDVIRAFREATDANIISTGTNMNNNLISVKLNKVPWKKGLASILQAQGLDLYETPPESGIYIVAPQPKEDPTKLSTRAFILKYIRAEEAAIKLKNTFGFQMDMLTGGQSILKQTGLVNIDWKNANDVQRLSTTPANLAAIDVERRISRVAPDAQANTVVVTATKEQLSACEDLLKTIDRPFPQIYIDARFMELSASASRKLGLKWDTLGNENGFGGAITPSGITYSDSKINTVLDRTYTLSKTGAQTTKSSSSTTATGTESGTETGATSTESYSIPGKVLSSYHDIKTVFSGTLSMDSFRLAMNAFDNLEGASIFSNPRVIVSNEKTAVVDMTTKEPNVEVAKNSATSTYGSDSYTVKLATIPGKTESFAGEAFFSYGIKLTVTPHINEEEGLITVDIEPEISSKSSEYKVEGTTDMPSTTYPIIAMRRISTSFTMKDGYTAVIGGLSQTTEDNVDSGIPLLRKIPWIGPRIFGWKSREKIQKEIVLFVTVGIANPHTMKNDVGLPKNAFLGREYTNGSKKEPGEGTRADFMKLDSRPVEDQNVTNAPAANLTQPAPAAAAAPATATPASAVTSPAAPVPAPVATPVAPAMEKPVEEKEPATAEAATPAPESPAVKVETETAPAKVELVPVPPPTEPTTVPDAILKDIKVNE